MRRKIKDWEKFMAESNQSRGNETNPNMGQPATETDRLFSKSPVSFSPNDAPLLTAEDLDANLDLMNIDLDADVNIDLDINLQNTDIDAEFKIEDLPDIIPTSVLNESSNAEKAMISHFKSPFPVFNSDYAPYLKYANKRYFGYQPTCTVTSATALDEIFDNNNETSEVNNETEVGQATSTTDQRDIQVMEVVTATNTVTTTAVTTSTVTSTTTEKPANEPQETRVPSTFIKTVDGFLVPAPVKKKIRTKSSQPKAQPKDIWSADFVAFSKLKPGYNRTQGFKKKLLKNASVLKQLLIRPPSIPASMRPIPPYEPGRTKKEQHKELLSIISNVPPMPTPTFLPNFNSKFDPIFDPASYGFSPSSYGFNPSTSQGFHNPQTFIDPLMREYENPSPTGFHYTPPQGPHFSIFGNYKKKSIPKGPNFMKYLSIKKSPLEPTATVTNASRPGFNYFSEPIDHTTTRDNDVVSSSDSVDSTSATDTNEVVIPKRRHHRDRT